MMSDTNPPNHPGTTWDQWTFTFDLLLGIFIVPLMVLHNDTFSSTCVCIRNSYTVGSVLKDKAISELVAAAITVAVCLRRSIPKKKSCKHKNLLSTEKYCLTETGYQPKLHTSL